MLRKGYVLRMFDSHVAYMTNSAEDEAKQISEFVANQFIESGKVTLVAEGWNYREYSLVPHPATA